MRAGAESQQRDVRNGVTWSDQREGEMIWAAEMQDLSGEMKSRQRDDCSKHNVS